MGSKTSGTPVNREDVERVLRLNRDGMSLREAAKLVGVSRDAVAEYRDDPFPLYRRLIRRCPECGHTVRMPCLSCAIKAEKRSKRKRPASA